MNQNTQLVKLDVATPSKLYKLSGYRWNKESNKKDAFCYYVRYLESKVNGNPEEAEEHKEEIKDIFFLDLCLNAISLARNNGIPAKIFSTVDELKPIMNVRGQEFDWVLKDMQISDQAVPEKFQRMAREINKAGINFDSYYIAEPKEKFFPAPSPRPNRDPVLLGVIGRWLCEIGRWD